MKDLITKLAMGVPIDDSGNDISPDKQGLQGNVTDIINVVIGILGLVCVVVMIIGGVNYMTSSGDTGKVKKAKDTILYGVIGLVVCALASVFSVSNVIVRTPSLSSAFTLFSSSRTCTGSAIVLENSPQ